MTKKYRIENQIFDLRNLVVAEIEIDGVRFQKVFESTERSVVKPSGKVEVKRSILKRFWLKKKLPLKKTGRRI